MTTSQQLLVSLALAIFISPATIAQDDFDHFDVRLGAFFTDRETDTRFDSNGGSPGDEIDMEDVLGLDKSDTVFRLDAKWRFANKHQLNFSWFDMSRDAVATIQEDFTWEGTDFEIDMQINSQFDMAVYKLAYTYRMLQRERGFLGITGGLYVADFDITLDGIGASVNETSGTTAILPVIGLRGQYDFSDRWSLLASAEFFALEYEAWDGSLRDLLIAVDYSFTEHFAMGVGFDSMTLDVDVAQSNLNGGLDWSYEGAMLYAKFVF